MTDRRSSIHRPRVWAAIGLTILLLLLAGLALLRAKFPFRESEVLRQFQAHTGAKAVIGKYQEVWFPPGFVAEQVTATNASGDRLTAARIFLSATYSGLIGSTKHFHRIEANGVQLTLAARPEGSGYHEHPIIESSGVKGSTVVDSIRLNDGTLTVKTSKPGSDPLTIYLKNLEVSGVGSHSTAATYNVSLHNSKPSSDIESKGRFGPIAGKPEETPIAGSFAMNNADLTIDRGISGILRASGEFKGPFRALECKGTADVPKFLVSGSVHPAHVSAQFDGTVDARIGDVVVNHVVARFLKTTVTAQGSVAEAQGGGKNIVVETAVQDGRVEDVLSLFTSKPRPAMSGPLHLKGKFTIPPGPPDFLTRLRMEGSFDILHGHFSSPKAQIPIDRLSASAAGEKKPEIMEDSPLVATDIHASVTDRNGVASLHHVVLEAPGMKGLLEGTFSLHQKQISLDGVLETTGKLSDTTGGGKGLLLKVLGPFWHRKAKVQTIPVHMGGTSAHPTFKLKFTD